VFGRTVAGGNRPESGAITLGREAQTTNR
jgi:hypothetical protein